MQQRFGGTLNALVLDLRDNPGGLLDAAVAVSQQLVPEGTEIVSTAGRVYGEGATLSYRSTKPPLLSPRSSGRQASSSPQTVEPEVRDAQLAWMYRQERKVVAARADRSLDCVLQEEL